MPIEVFRVFEKKRKEKKISITFVEKLYLYLVTVYVCPIEKIDKNVRTQSYLKEMEGYFVVCFR